MPKILNVVGARPNLMKIAPLCREMAVRSDIDMVLVHTGQHYDDYMSKIFFDQLSIPLPDRHLGVGSGTREEQIARITEAFRPVLLAEAPDVVLVVGDVNSTIACARVAHNEGVPVAHVEAGLRSFDLSMPEEINRMETDAISNYLFATEPAALDNLAKEGAPGRVWMVGNVMIDTLVYNLDRAGEVSVLDDFGLERTRFALGTFHRPSNVDSPERLESLVTTIAEICARIPLVLPLHPRTRHSLEKHGFSSRLADIPRLILSDPLGYLEFLNLLSNARVVITDSGGIQEESTYLGVPCLTMRENTERPITVSIGTNVLIGNDHGALLVELEKVLSGSAKTGRIPDLWDGRAATRIVDLLVAELTPSQGVGNG